jgi:hypothetical protein
LLKSDIVEGDTRVPFIFSDEEPPEPCCNRIASNHSFISAMPGFAIILSTIDVAPTTQEIHPRAAVSAIDCSTNSHGTRRLFHRPLRGHANACEVSNETKIA